MTHPIIAKVRTEMMATFVALFSENGIETVTLEGSKVYGHNALVREPDYTPMVQFTELTFNKKSRTVYVRCLDLHYEDDEGEEPDHDRVMLSSLETDDIGTILKEVELLLN